MVLHALLVMPLNSETSLELFVPVWLDITNSIMKIKLENAKNVILNVRPVLFHLLLVLLVILLKTELLVLMTMDIKLVSVCLDFTQLLMDHVFNLIVTLILSALNVRKVLISAFNVWLLRTELSNFQNQSVFVKMDIIPMPTMIVLLALKDAEFVPVLLSAHLVSLWPLPIMMELVLVPPLHTSLSLLMVSDIVLLVDPIVKYV